MNHHVHALAASLLLTFAVPPAEIDAGQREILIGANSIAGELKPGSVLAVVDFTDLRGGVTELGRFIAEEMALGLASSAKGLSVIDRTHLKALMQEHKLNASGLIDPATARRLGQIAGVQGLVTGTITPFADSVRVVVKVLDTETARIMTATSVDITKNRTIEELLGRDLVSVASTPSQGAGPATSQQPMQTPRSTALSVQNGRFRISVSQLSVSSDNREATVGLIIENTSQETVLLAAEEMGYTGSGRAQSALSDDRGTSWLANDTQGIPLLNGDLTRMKESDMNALGPSDRVTIVLTFRRQNGVQTIGSSYTVALNGLVSAGSGIRRVSLGISGIKPGFIGR